MEDRKKQIFKAEDQYFDLVIIGGGITGAGIARDASGRLMKVALFEKDEFASGTSSRSSKLVHGGIRYLESLEIGLVLESLRERAILFEIAPHLVQPLSFMMPMYKGSRMGMNKISIGLWLYDLLAFCGGGSLAVHQRLSVKQALREVPLKQTDLLGAFIYLDAYTDDRLLTVETIASAQRQGALCMQHAFVEKVMLKNNRCDAVQVRCAKTNRQFTVRAKHFVGALGPWVDIFGEKNFAKWKTCLSPTKGVHIVLKKEKLNINHAVVIPDDKNSRIIFVIPKGDVLLIGTTETTYKEDPSEVKVLPEDINYLLTQCANYFPKVKITKEDVIDSYAGVRPLVSANDKDSPTRISRRHKIWTDRKSLQNVTFVAGGKLTTYRKIAEDVVDHILQRFSLEDRLHFTQSCTLEPLNPKITFTQIQKALQMIPIWSKETGHSHEHLQKLIYRYGMETEDILNSDK